MEDNFDILKEINKVAPSASLLDDIHSRIREEEVLQKNSVGIYTFGVIALIFVFSNVYFLTHFRGDTHAENNVVMLKKYVDADNTNELYIYE